MNRDQSLPLHWGNSRGQLQQSPEEENGNIRSEKKRWKHAFIFKKIGSLSAKTKDGSKSVSLWDLERLLKMLCYFYWKLYYKTMSADSSEKQKLKRVIMSVTFSMKELGTAVQDEVCISLWGFVCYFPHYSCRSYTWYSIYTHWQTYIGSGELNRTLVFLQLDCVTYAGKCVYFLHKAQWFNWCN